MDQIKVGVIGCGYWGPNLIRNFVEIPTADVVIVADLKDERLCHIRSCYPQINATKNYKDLFTLGLDAAVIATPPATHYQFAKECLQHGLHVLVEKPMTINSEQAEDLIKLAQENGQVLMVGHTFEYNAAVHTLKQLIDSGELGQIYYVDSARLSLGLYQRDLNVLWDLAPHDISILLYILGRNPITVSAYGMPFVFEHTHDVVYVNMLFPDNILAHIHVSWLDPCKVRRITVVGSKKMVVYNDVSNMEKIKIFDKGVEIPPYTTTFGDFQCSYRSGDVLIPNIRFVEPLRRECQHFLECILNHCEPQSNGLDGLGVIQVLEAAQRSLDKNGANQAVVTWEWETACP
jgi:predicted dehydrogenase